MSQSIVSFTSSFLPLRLACFFEKKQKERQGRMVLAILRKSDEGFRLRDRLNELNQLGLDLKSIGTSEEELLSLRNKMRYLSASELLDKFMKFDHGWTLWDKKVALECFMGYITRGECTYVQFGFTEQGFKKLMKDVKEKATARLVEKKEGLLWEAERIQREIEVAIW